MKFIFPDGMDKTFGKKSVVETVAIERKMLGKGRKRATDLDIHRVGSRFEIDLEHLVHRQCGEFLGLAIDRLAVHLRAGTAIILGTGFQTGGADREMQIVRHIRRDGAEGRGGREGGILGPFHRQVGPIGIVLRDGVAFQHDTVKETRVRIHSIRIEGE